MARKENADKITKEFYGYKLDKKQEKIIIMWLKTGHKKLKKTFA